MGHAETLRDAIGAFRGSLGKAAAAHDDFVRRAAEWETSRRVILVVDDEEMVARAIVAVLRRDYVCDVALSGSEALRMFTLRPYVLAIVDMHMPDLLGVEVTEQIHARQPGLPVIVTSAIAGEDLERLAKRCGATRWLSKPFDAHALLDMVNELLGA